MLTLLEVEQKISEQIKQNDAIIGCLQSAEIILRQRIEVMHKINLNAHKIPFSQKNDSIAIKNMIFEFNKKNDSLLRDIQARIQILNLSLYNLDNTNNDYKK